MLNDKLNPNKAIFLMIDIQEKLLPVMSSPEELIKNNHILLTGIKNLGIPTIISEQYPKGLGHTVSPLSEFVTNENLLEKDTFSLYREHNDIFDKLISSGKNQFIISGIEAHICVYQTAKDLLHKGTEVFMVSDAISSRQEKHKTQIFHTLLHMGANILPVETVLFELLGDTKNSNFKTISKLIK